MLYAGTAVMLSGIRAVMTEAGCGPSSDPAVVADFSHHEWHWGGIDMLEFIGHCLRKRERSN